MKSQLVIEISDSAVRFACLKGGEVQSVDFLKFKDKTDIGYKEALDVFVKSKGYREVDYDDYSLSWCTEISSLIPNNVYSETSSEDILRLSYNEVVPQGYLDHNRIPELSIVNVFSIPLWVKSFFVIRFPRIIIQHEGSHLLHGLLNTSTFTLQVSLVLHEDNFNITITNSNDLEFYSYFDYENEDDIIYHLMYCLQQKNLLNKKGTILLCAGVGANDQLIISLKLKLDKIKDLGQLKHKINSHLLLNYQSLCV